MRASRLGAATPLVLATVFLGATLVGCRMDQRYVTPESGMAWQLALTPETPPFFSSEDGTVYLIEQRIELPIRAPDPVQFAALSTPDARGLGPYPRRPWVERGDYEIEIDAVLSNLSEQPARVTVVVNGFNEFHEYLPGANVVDDDVLVDFSQWERTYDLDAMSRRSFTIREEDMDEVAVDLATVVNGAPNSNQVVFFQNHSAHDPRSRAYIPPIVPALTGFRIGLRVEAGTPPPLALEAIVRVRDVHDKIVGEGETSWELPVPAPFVPVAPMQE